MNGYIGGNKNGMIIQTGWIGIGQLKMQGTDCQQVEGNRDKKQGWMTAN